MQVQCSNLHQQPALIVYVAFAPPSKIAKIELIRHSGFLYNSRSHVGCKVIMICEVGCLDAWAWDWPSHMLCWTCSRSQGCGTPDA